MIANANDTIPLQKSKITEQGYLVADGIIARTGIQEYYGYEFGLDGLKPNDIIRLYRPPSEVFAPDSLASFENAPITIGHPDVNVTVDNWKEIAKGELTNVRKQNDSHVCGKLTVKDGTAISAIQNGKKQLSNGYSFTLDMTPGVINGQAYDGIQRNIRGNHLALVDRARCGSACSIIDNNPEPITKGEPNMADITLRKMVVDGIPVEVSDAAAAVIEKLQKALDGKDADLVELTKSVETLTNDHSAKIAAKDAEIAELKKSVMTPHARDAMVAEWASLIGTAKKLKPEIEVVGKDCETVRREVVDFVMAQDNSMASVAKSIVKDGTPSGDLLKIVFDAIAPLIEETEIKANDGEHFAAQQPKPSIVGRDKFLKTSQDAWQQPGVKQHG